MSALTDLRDLMAGWDCDPEQEFGAFRFVSDHAAELLKALEAMESARPVHFDRIHDSLVYVWDWGRDSEPFPEWIGADFHETPGRVIFLPEQKA